MSTIRTPLVPDGGLSRGDFLRLTGVGVASIAAASPLAAAAAGHRVEPAASPKRGGVLRLGDTGDVVSFEPYAVSDNWSIWTMLLVYDQLTRPTVDGLNIEPALASS